MNRDYIDDLILGYCDGTLSDEEKDCLNEWIESSADHDKYFSDLVRTHALLHAVGKWEAGDRKDTYLSLIGKKRHVRKMWYGIAAACVACLVLSSLFFMQPGDGKRGAGSSFAEATKVDAGEIKAYLQLERGDCFELSKGKSEYQEVKRSIEVRDSLPALLAWHKVVVPSGGEYSMVLDDGTKVWLNSASELKVPASFEEDARYVYLKGEAYFEVASDSSRPFLVNLADGVVRVVGTSFNVSSYEDDRRVEVALLEGKVAFRPVEKEEYSLLPGQIVTLDKDRREVSIREGDVKAIAGWHAGNFIFEDMPLRELAVKLERWYQVRFEFSDKTCGEMRFSGAVEKHRSLDYVLDIISRMAPVCFESVGEEQTIRVRVKERNTN